MGETFAEISKSLPAWVLALVAVGLLIDKMGLLRRQWRRTDASETSAAQVEDIATNTVGQSASTAHHEVARLSALVRSLGDEVTRLNGELSKYQAENLGQAHTIRRVNESRQRLLELLVKANRMQNDLIAANVLDEKLIEGVTIIQQDFDR